MKQLILPFIILFFCGCREKTKPVMRSNSGYNIGGSFVKFSDTAANLDHVSKDTVFLSSVGVGMRDSTIISIYKPLYKIKNQ